MNFKIPAQEIAQQQAFACLDMESEHILKNLLTFYGSYLEFVSYAPPMHPLVFSNDEVLCGYK